MFRFFANRRYFKLYFLMQKDGNIHQLSREVDMTTSHLSIVTDQLEREGLIIKHRKGRECSIELTEAGKEFGEILRKYDELATELLNKIKNNPEGKNERQS